MRAPLFDRGSLDASPNLQYCLRDSAMAGVPLVPCAAMDNQSGLNGTLASSSVTFRKSE